MLRIEKLRDQKDSIKNALKKRGLDDSFLSVIDSLIALDDDRKNVQTSLDEMLSQANSISKEIGQLFKSGKQEEANAKKAEVAKLKESSKELELKLKATKDDIVAKLITIPNVPHDSVPDGLTEEDNEVFKAFDGALPDEEKAHWDLTEKYNLVDFKLGAKIAGSGFPLYRGKGAKLQRALIQFFLDEATAAGYEEIIPPLLVNEDTARATGQLPDKEGQMYYAEKDDLYLIPTAEVPITNIYRNIVVKESDFPIKMTGYTPCFRREAGSYGSDVKGLNRVHQFDKIEIVEIAKPEESYEILDRMVSYVGGILDKLELPYRILRLCGGDIGFTSALTFDFEVYAAGQKKWLEVSSVSNFEDFQSNRLKVRYKNEQGKMVLAHTLNGSALALARIFASIIENYQTSDGINIPKVLIPYTGFEKID